MIPAINLRSAGHITGSTGCGILGILQIRIHCNLIFRAVIRGVEGCRTDLRICFSRQHGGKIGTLGRRIAGRQRSQPAEGVMGLLGLVVVILLCNGHHIIVGGLILIGDPGIAVLRAVITPAVLDEPCTVIFRLEILIEILLGIVIVPSNQQYNVVAKRIVRTVIGLCLRITEAFICIVGKGNAVTAHQHSLQVFVGTSHLAGGIIHITVVDICILHMVCCL